MTELIIDGQRVVLPSTLSLSIIHENAFFTKKGEFTYDIELSLQDSTNAIIYKHCNRLNNSAPIATGRSAVLISDNKIIMNGTEVIIGNTDTSVKIQLVSGNSELNYFIGSDKKLRSLDLGVAIIDKSTIVSDLDHPYPERDWLLLPFLNKDNETVGNRFAYWNGACDKDYTDSVVIESNIQIPTLKYMYNGDRYHSLGNNQYIPPYAAANFDSDLIYENYRPQPYFCFIIKQVLLSLGYTISLNQIAEHPIFKYYYIVHGFNTLNFAKMLPDWTVKEFFEEIEKLFDVTIFIYEDKKVDILFNYNFLQNVAVEHLQIIDQFSREIDTTNKLSHQDVNIAYSLDDDEYYKYHKIDTAINKLISNAPIIADWRTIQNALLARINDATDLYRFNKIFKTNSFASNSQIENNLFIALNDGLNPVYPRKIDSFRNLMLNNDNDETIDIELKIIPAAMKLFKDTLFVGIRMYDENGIQEPDLGNNYCSSFYQIPVAEISDPFFQKDTNDEYLFTVNGLINGSEEIPSESLPSKMRLAIFDGRKQIDLFTSPYGFFLHYDNMAAFPTSYVEALSESFKDIYTWRIFGQNNSFQLSWMNEKIYSLSKKIDTTKTFKFTFIDNKRFDVRSSFLINNRLYLCNRIERTITENGLLPLADGYFYPID